ncbi:MAG: hypothetical protein HN826_07555 [Methylococcales bacterium]|jgi:hypothetical protein|nr:hypothetical protein [Methylococcales bacterium]
MSEISLSPKLIEDVHQLLKSHDSESNNPLVFVQYLSAIMGIVINEMPGDKAVKDEFVEEVFAFVQHVMNTQGPNSQAPAPAGNPEEAFGVWKPGDD